jgi:hypothetical protein
MTVTEERLLAEVDDAEPAGRQAAALRWVRWLCDLVFPTPTVPQRPSRKAALGYLLSFVAAVGYLLVIPAGQSHLDRIWGEDGVIFLQAALKDGFFTPLFTPYAGYIHMLPRLSAAMLAHLPVAWYAAGLAVTAASVRAGMAALVYAATNGHVRSPLLRFVIAGALIVLPSGNNETLDNLANLHWFVLFAAFWLLLWRPETRWQNALSAFALFLFVLTSPIGVFLIPLVAVRFALPRRRDRVPAIAYLVGMAITIVPILTATRPHSPFDLTGALEASAARGPMVTFTGPELAAHVYPKLVGHGQHFYWWPAALATVVTLALAGIAIVWGTPSRRFLVIASLFLGSAIIFTSLHSNWADMLRINATGVVMTVERYSAGPCLFFLTAIAVGLAQRPRPSLRYPAIAARVIVALVIATGVVYQWQSGAAPLRGITWSSAMAAAKKECATGRKTVNIKTIPETRTFIEVPCVDLH